MFQRLQLPVVKDLKILVAPFLPQVSEGKQQRSDLLLVADGFKDLMRSKNTSGYFSFYIDNISIKTYST